jgi:hypothetical protein
MASIETLQLFDRDDQFVARPMINQSVRM